MALNSATDCTCGGVGAIGVVHTDVGNTFTSIANERSQETGQSGEIKMKLTQKEYVAKGGVACPACGSGKVHGGDRNFESIHLAQNCECLTCGAEWTAIYTLTGYDNLHISPHK